MTTSSTTMLSDRALIRIAGDDPRGFLQGLVTQDMAELTADRPLWGGLLTPQGKALFDFIVWDDADGAVLLDCEAAQTKALARRLAIYRLRRAVTIEPAAGAVHWSATAGAGYPDPRLAALGFRWLGDAGSVAAGWHDHRRGLGVTEGAAELGTGSTLWLECNADLLHGVSFTKGCYVGQENTARMHHRAKVRRRLAVVPAPAGGTDNQSELGAAKPTEWSISLRRVDEWGNAVRPAWLADAVS